MVEEPLKKKFDLINLGYDIATDSEKTLLKEKVQGLLKDLKKMHEENLKDLVWKIGFNQKALR